MHNAVFAEIVGFIRKLYNSDEYIPLHVPVFAGNEKKYLVDCIESGYVSSVGSYVNRLEKMTQEYTGIAHAVAAVNGTAALHIALLLAGVMPEDEVITQPVTFVATINALRYCNARPIFLDVDREFLGLSSEKLEEFLHKNAQIRDDGFCYNIASGRRFAACLPMHVFGHPVRIDRIVDICNGYNIPVVEDAAESIGSTYKGAHTGSFGINGVYSFNGNKTITTGGGGMIVTNDEEMAKRAKHLTTTAKVSHQWEYVHDEVGFNYRMPNINAALGCAQMEYLPQFIEEKRTIADQYNQFFYNKDITFVSEGPNCRSNYWLNAIVLKNREERDEFLSYTNENKVMTRPLWCLMNKLPMYKKYQTYKLEEAYWLEDRIVNIPSSVRL